MQPIKKPPMTLSWPKCMGVINITPDSFSDGGSLPDLNSLIQRIDSLKKAGATIIDIGAQSTAPMAKPISIDEEMDRFKRYLLPLLKTWDPHLTLSIDTYRPEVFKWLYSENTALDWIFNDVSGHQDLEVLKECPNARIVIGHNLCPTRDEAPNHLNYIIPSKENLLDHLESFFKSKNLSDRIILDPLFGFSKNLDQNLQLLNLLPELIKRFPPEQVFLIGISKKSFLRKSLPKTADPLNDSEYLHLLFLSHFMKELKEHNLIFRVHDPRIWSLASRGTSLIENTPSLVP
jgi:dihydropteroate synthase